MTTNKINVDGLLCRRRQKTMAQELVGIIGGSGLGDALTERITDA